MSLLKKALDFARKNAALDPGATIRNALGAAGLMPDTALPGASTCLAPNGAAASLDTLLPALRARRKAPGADETVPEGGRFVWRTVAAHGRRYRLYSPDKAEPPQALVVMLHGCSQDPDDFAAGTQMNTLGAQHNVAVAYPEQVRSANVSLCWNWFNPADQHRGRGEPALIAAIAGEAAAAFGLPPARCFVAGLSAGGAMAAIMAEAYPDLFAAVGIHSGLPYGAATDMGSAFAAMRGGGKGAVLAERLAHEGMPTIVFHGEADGTVSPLNADAIVARLEAAGLSRQVEQGRAAGGETFRRTIARDGDGHIRFEDWRVAGGGHAWFGGSAGGSYTDPRGPDASAEMLRFFLAQAGGAPPARS